MAKAYAGTVELNGVAYVISGPVVEQPVDDWGETVRTQSLQARLDALYRSNQRLNLGAGLLWARLEGDQGGLWDSTLETRWADQGLVCLPPLLQAGTTETKVSAATAVSVAAASTGLCVRYIVTTTGAVLARWNGTAWSDETPGTTDLAFTNTRGKQIEVHRDVLYTPTAAGGAAAMRYSTDGGDTWNSMTGGTGSTSDPTFLRSIGARIFHAISGGAVHYTTDQSTAWTNAGNHGLGTLTGLASYWDDNGDTFPHLVTQSGVFRCDVNGVTPVQVLDLTPYGGGTDNGRGTIFWPQAGSLMVPIDDGQGGLLQFQIIPGQGHVVRQVGLDQGAGLPAASQASIVDLLPVGRWLFALTEPGSDGLCRVYAFDGQRWHYITSRTDAQPWALGFSAVGGTPRLFLIGDNNTTTLDIDVLENITKNPENVSTYAYAASGIADLAYIGGDMSEMPTAWLRIAADIDGLSATTAGEYVAVSYGTNGAARTTTSLGNFLSGDLDLDFATGTGVSARTLGLRLTFNRDAGNTTDSPKWRGAGLDYRKKPPVRTAWRFRVDVDASAMVGNRTTEDVIANLKTVRDSVTQVSFSFPGQSAVKVAPQLPWAFVWEIPESPDPQESGPRSCIADILVVQLAP